MGAVAGCIALDACITADTCAGQVVSDGAAGAGKVLAAAGALPRALSAAAGGPVCSAPPFGRWSDWATGPRCVGDLVQIVHNADSCLEASCAGGAQVVCWGLPAARQAARGACGLLDAPGQMPRWQRSCLGPLQPPREGGGDGDIGGAGGGAAGDGDGQHHVACGGGRGRGARGQGAPALVRRFCAGMCWHACHKPGGHLIARALSPTCRAV